MKQEEKQRQRLMAESGAGFFHLVNSILDRPTTDLVDKIPQSRMKNFLILERYYDLIKEAYEKEQQELLEAVDKKIIQEDGELIAIVETTEQRRPKWSALFEQYVSKEKADMIRKETKPSTSLKLVVTFAARLLEAGGISLSRIEK